MAVRPACLLARLLTRLVCGGQAKPELDLSAINFRPTMMFQTRAFTFPLTNTSTAQMDYKWAVCGLDGEPDVDSIYEVRPEGGVVEAGSSVDITVRFKPVEVVDARRLLVANIPHRAEGGEQLQRQLNGRILRPWCHFEMPESDYLAAGRRNPNMKGPDGDLGPLDPATRVVEFESLGTRVRNTKRFFVLNPTSMSYEFFWEPQRLEGGGSAPTGPFRCLTHRGVCQSGKRYEMAFEYMPEDDAVTEGFWQFRIPDQGITVPFLMVGHVKEPRVSLDRPGVHFGKVLVGTNVTETLRLVNSENIPFSFSFDKATYEASRERIESTGQAPVVQFSPADGTVMANSSLPIQVGCSPPPPSPPLPPLPPAPPGCHALLPPPPPPPPYIVHATTGGVHRCACMLLPRVQTNRTGCSARSPNVRSRTSRRMRS